MSFLDKNFTYTKKPFGEFIDDIQSGGEQYLRALSATSPTREATHLQEDFPTIASDFQLPDELEFVKTHEHSSPLRISGPVAMWLHYDVS